MTYPPILPSDDASLHWRQPDASKFRFDLTAAGDRTLGHVEITSWKMNLVMAETAAGVWRFEHVGLWSPKVRALVDDVEVATLEVKNAWLGNRASLVAPDGHVIGQWVTAMFAMGSAEWQDAEGQTLIAFRSGTDEGGMATWWRTQCRVDFTAAGFAHPDRDLMLTIGWYFTVIASNPAI
jgi:hypothetical protein